MLTCIIIQTDSVAQIELRCLLGVVFGSLIKKHFKDEAIQFFSQNFKTSHDVIWFNAMLIPRVVSDPIGETFV